MDDRKEFTEWLLNNTFIWYAGGGMNIKPLWCLQEAVASAWDGLEDNRLIRYTTDEIIEVYNTQKKQKIEMERQLKHILHNREETKT